MEKFKKLPHGTKVYHEGKLCYVVKRSTIKGTIVTRIICAVTQIPQEVIL